MVIKIGRLSSVLFLFLCSPIRKYTSMFHVERDLTVRSGTNNTVQPAPSLSFCLSLSDFRSLRREELSFFSTVPESKDIDAMYHVSLFFYSKSYDRFHLVKISHFLTYDNILDSWPLENQELARLILTTDLYRSAMLYATPVHWRDLISLAASPFLPSLCLRIRHTAGVTKRNKMSSVPQTVSWSISFIQRNNGSSTKSYIPYVCLCICLSLYGKPCIIIKVRGHTPS